MKKDFSDFQFYIDRTKQNYPDLFKKGYICFHNRAKIKTQDLEEFTRELDRRWEWTKKNLIEAYGVNVESIFEFRDIELQVWDSCGLVVPDGYIPMFIRYEEDPQLEDWVVERSKTITRFDLMDL